MTSRQYLVRGRVQGVFYRSFTSRAAARYGIVGFARNRTDGRVEVIAVGADDALARFRTELEGGPPGARVDGVDEVDFESSETFTSFTIRG